MSLTLFLNNTFIKLVPACQRLSVAFRMIVPALMTIAAPVTNAALRFALLSATLLASFGGVKGIGNGFTSLEGIIRACAAAMSVLSVSAKRLPSTFSAMSVAVTNFMKQFKKLPAIFTRTLSSCVSALTSKCARMVSAFAQAGSRMISSAQSAMNSIVRIVSNVNLYSAGVNIMSGLNRGLLSASSAVIATANQIANSISNTINRALDIHSPSRVTEDSGYYTGMGTVVGMKKSLPIVKKTALQLAEASISYDGDYTPTNSSTANTISSVDNSTFSPQFNLTVSGTTDDRKMARKIKKWIAEALNEAFSGYADKTTVTREV